jgi:hypothetical protein
VMMLLTLLISRKMFFSENLSFTRVAGDGMERCVCRGYRSWPMRMGGSVLG